MRFQSHLTYVRRCVCVCVCVLVDMCCTLVYLTAVLKFVLSVFSLSSQFK